MIHVRDISIRRVYLVLYLFIFSCYYSDNNFKSKVGVSKVFVFCFFFPTQIQETQIWAHLKLIIPAWHVRPSRIWSRPNSSHLHSLMQPNWSLPVLSIHFLGMRHLNEVTGMKVWCLSSTSFLSTPTKSILQGWLRFLFLYGDASDYSSGKWYFSACTT